MDDPYEKIYGGDYDCEESSNSGDSDNLEETEAAIKATDPKKLEATIDYSGKFTFDASSLPPVPRKRIMTLRRQKANSMKILRENKKRT
mmetsp:Transcript_3738/g.6739  ORF Transcript_3738/g.6739 Transcript_3738/m.6739 type:complete len:89 (+) Transcript_3738:344-610(+)